MDVEECRLEFTRKVRLYEQLKDETLFIIEPAINDAGIKLHSITSRVKTVDSFLDKVQRKQSVEPFEEIRDIVGVRVICLFLSDIERIGQLIRESFTVLDEDNKVEGTDVASFGYMSFHFIAQMKKEHAGPRYDPIAKIPVEIQVRTIAMDAWANVSHYLSYKGEKDVPTELRRDFYALSGLFYVADRHFEMFFRSSRESHEKMVELFKEAPQQTRLEQEINLDSLTAYLRDKFPDRQHAEAKVMSELVEELAQAGYGSINDIERAFEMGWEAFLYYDEKLEETYDFTPQPGYKKFLADVGAMRAILVLVDDKFDALWSPRVAPQVSELFKESRKLIKKE